MLQKNYTVATSNGLFETYFISGVIIVQRIRKEMVLFPGLITEGCNQMKMIKVKYFISIVNKKAKVPIYEWVTNCFKVEEYGEQFHFIKQYLY